MRPKPTCLAMGVAHAIDYPILHHLFTVASLCTPANGQRLIAAVGNNASVTPSGGRVSSKVGVAEWDAAKTIQCGAATDTVCTKTPRLMVEWSCNKSSCRRCVRKKAQTEWFMHCGDREPPVKSAAACFDTRNIAIVLVCGWEFVSSFDTMKRKDNHPSIDELKYITMAAFFQISNTVIINYERWKTFS